MDLKTDGIRAVCILVTLVFLAALVIITREGKQMNDDMRITAIRSPGLTISPDPIEDTLKALREETDKELETVVNVTPNETARLTPSPTPTNTPVSQNEAKESPKPDVFESILFDEEGNFLRQVQVGYADTEIYQVPYVTGKVLGKAKAESVYPLLRTAENGWYEILTEDGISGYIPYNSVTDDLP